jgi:hypothetical protein
MKLGNTLRLSIPFGQTFALALVVLAFFWGAAEMIARAPAVRQRFPFPSVNGPNATFDQDLTELDRQMVTRGRVDCVVLGSSMVLNDFQPAAFEASYQAQTETELKCVNFGIAGMTIWESGDIARLLADVFHPQLLIFGTSARDYQDSIRRKQRHDHTLGALPARPGFFAGRLADRTFLRLSLSPWLAPLDPVLGPTAAGPGAASGH